MLVFVMVLLIVLILIQSSNESTNREIIKTEKFDDDDEIMDLRERLTSLERNLLQVRVATENKNVGYPTIEQLAAMRHDVDKLIAVTIPNLEKRINNHEEKIIARLDKLLAERLRKHFEEKYSKGLNVSMMIAPTANVRFVWFDAQGAFLNENHDLLHPYVEDVTVVHRVALHENRFYSHLRTVNSIDVFRPVSNHRNQFLVLMVTGKGDRKKTLLTSGLCINVNLNFRFATTKSYESGNVRLLTAWGLLYDRFHVVFGAFFPIQSTLSSSSPSLLPSLSPSLSPSSSLDDHYQLVERLIYDTRTIHFDNPLYKSNDYKVFILGDFDVTLEKFNHFRERFDFLRCEYDSCVNGPIITSITKGYYHNVHALTNTEVLDFNATQTKDSSISVRTIFSTTRTIDEMNGRKYGATDDSTHNRKIL